MASCWYCLFSQFLLSTDFHLVLSFIEEKAKQRYSKLVLGGDLDPDWIHTKIRDHCWARRKKLQHKKENPKGTPEFATDALLAAQFNLTSEKLQKFLLSQGVTATSTQNIISAISAPQG